MASPHDLLRHLRSPAEACITIPASPEAVFAVLSDPETYPDWLAGAQRIRRASIHDPPRRLQLEVHVGPATGIIDFELTRCGDGTEVRFREAATGRLELAMPLLRGPIHLRNRASLERLKKRFEPLVIAL